MHARCCFNLGPRWQLAGARNCCNEYVMLHFKIQDDWLSLVPCRLTESRTTELHRRVTATHSSKSKRLKKIVPRWAFEAVVDRVPLCAVIGRLVDMTVLHLKRLLTLSQGAFDGLCQRLALRIDTRPIPTDDLTRATDQKLFKVPAHVSGLHALIA